MVKYLLSLSEALIQSAIPPSVRTPKGMYFVSNNVEYRITGFFRFKKIVIFKEVKINFELGQSSKFKRENNKLKKKKLSIEHGIFQLVML